MTKEEFEIIDKHFMQMVDQVLYGKGDHYMDGDRFSNFIEAAMLEGTEVEDEMRAQMRKHVIGFFTCYRKGTMNDTKFWEHGGDIINFIRLLYAWRQREKRHVYGEEQVQTAPRTEGSGCERAKCRSASYVEGVEKRLRGGAEEGKLPNP